MQRNLWKRHLAITLGAALIVTSVTPGILAGAEDAASKEYIADGGFEAADLSAWTVTAQQSTAALTKDSGNFKEGVQAFNFWSEKGETFTLTQKIAGLPAGNYELTAQSQGGDGETVSVIFNGEEGDVSQKDSGWGNWMASSGVFHLAETADVEVGIKVTAAAGGWGQVDCVSLLPTTKEPAEKVEPVKSDLYVERINGLSKDFIRGMDISSVKVEYDSGVKCYDFAGKELVLSPKEGEKGFFTFLKECGTNWVRIRVWNDPFDGEGHGYGGGNNDINVAAELGKLATDAGLCVLIDFHYSDFWADPERQLAPKAWKDMDLAAKSKALGDFTTQSLQKLKEAGVDVGMVQVGNETVGGMAGETLSDASDVKTRWEAVATLMKAGSEAIRAFDKNILIALHFTDPGEAGKYESIAKALDENKVDYDIFASSYYPYYHGTLENLTTVMKQVADTYGKKLLVAETSYQYTNVDGDQGGTTSLDAKYDISPQGQANSMVDVIKAVQKMGDAGLGVMYWEPAWIPVNVVDWDNDPNAQAVLDKNKEIWNQYGSGWASKYAEPYDANSQWWGGSAQDNQGLFDFNGKPLESMNIFNYIYTGTTAEKSLAKVQDKEWTVVSNEEWSMPETVSAVYVDDSTEEFPVVWDSEQVQKAKSDGVGSYTIDGKITADNKEYSVKCALTIQRENLLKNPGFEEGDTGWTLTGDGLGIAQDSSNVRNGEYCLKYYTKEGTEYRAEQKITLDAGVYQLSAFTQGGVGDGATFQLYAKVGEDTYTENTSVSDWQNWSNPTIPEIKITKNSTELTVGIYMKTNPEGWGSWDDFYLQKTADLTGVEEPGDSDTDPETPAAKKKKLAAPKIKGISVKKQTITVKWGKVSNAAGYKVQYSTKKNFKGAKVKKVSSGKKVSVKIDVKKKKTKFFVRVSAAAKAGSKYKASAYSSVKSIKTK